MSNRTIAGRVGGVDQQKPDPHLDLRALNQFLLVCEAGSMSAAARRVGHSTAAVSQTIIRLEHDLGVILFERSPHGLRLTPGGVVLRDRATALLASARDSLDELKAYRGQLLPSLRLYVLDDVGIHLMKAMVPELTRLVRRFELFSTQTLMHVRDFITGEIDILISAEDFTSIASVDRYRLCRQKLLALAPASAPAHKRDIRSLAATLPLIRFREHSRLDLLVQAFIDQHDLSLQRTIECDCSATVMELISAGLAWAIITPLNVSSFRHRWNDIVWMPLPEPVPGDALFLVAGSERFLDLPPTLARLSRAALRREVAAWTGTVAEPAIKAVIVDADD